MKLFHLEDKALSKRLKEQDKQLKSVLKAEEVFEKTNDLSTLIKFWEDVWEQGGLKFNGSKWTFRLPDIYIKEKRYDDALRILKKIKDPVYSEKVAGYVERISKLKAKKK